MKTTIDTHCYPSNVDLSDIGNMVKQYCNEVERLEEQLDEKDNRIEELEMENRILKERLEEKT